MLVGLGRLRWFVFGCVCGGGGGGGEGDGLGRCSF